MSILSRRGIFGLFGGAVAVPVVNALPALNKVATTASAFPSLEAAFHLAEEQYGLLVRWSDADNFLEWETPEFWTDEPT